MNKQLYDSNGYVNMDYVITTPVPFIFVVGGRGTGKTYGALKYCIDEGKRHILMRRTQAQADIISKPEFSPYKSICDDMGIDIDLSKPITKNSRAIINRSENDEYLGFTCALSTISNIRGMDASDIDYLIYDEFIPEKHERPLKNEASAFFNAYETLNRNREIKGGEPLKVIALANANDLGNQLFMALKLVLTVEKMYSSGAEKYIDYNRGIAIFCLSDSKISEKKRETALYKAVGEESDFSKMALENSFAYDDTSRDISRPLVEYKPIATCGELTIYKHKHRLTYYVTDHKSGNPPTYGTTDIELKRFQRDFRLIWAYYMQNKVEFQSYYHELLFRKYFDYA